MSSESWLKISLPAFPLSFVVFGNWLYWKDNIVALVPPTMAFWGVMILFYLFSHLDTPKKRYPLILTMATSLLWLVATITSHNLAAFVASRNYSGLLSVLSRTDFWYAYVFSAVGCAIGLLHFFLFEPVIVKQLQSDRAFIRAQQGT